MFQIYDKKYGVMGLVPNSKSMPVKSGKVLLTRTKKSGKVVLESYDLKDLKRKLPEKILADYGYQVDEKTVIDEITTRVIGDKTIFVVSKDIDISSLEDQFEDGMTIEDIRSIFKAGLSR